MWSGWFSANSGGYYHGGEERAAAFRYRHKVGETVRGRILSHEGGRLFWINMQGTKLLAELDSAAAVGDVRIFQIQSLAPNIVLKELPCSSHGANAPDLPARQLLAERLKFESDIRVLRKILADMRLPSLEDRKQAFLDLLREKKELLKGYRKLAALEHPINAELQAKEQGTYRYVPWFLPEATGQDMLFSSPPEDNQHWEAVFDFNLPAAGRGQAKLVFKSPKLSIRLFLERPNEKDLTDQIIASAPRQIAEADVHFTGTSPLPAKAPGILSSLIASNAVARPRLNTRV